MQDIALLRATSNEILSTNRGYLLQKKNGATRIYKVYHTNEQTEEEYYAPSLTYRDFLTKYKVMMRDGGAVEFKTDNDDLFDFSLEEFKETGFTLEQVTRDLHNSEYDEDNIRTEFEQKFADQGITIKRVVAVM